MKSTFSILFVAQKGKLRPNGRAPIYARITVNGQMSHFSTRFDVEPDRWLPKESRTAGTNREEKQVNSMLEELRAAVRNRYHEMVNRGEVITASKLKNSLMSLDEKCMTLLQLFDDFNEDYSQLVKTNSVTHCTYQRYLLTRSRIADYLLEKHKIADIPLADLTHGHIKGFDLWLRTTHKSANNTAAKFIKHLRTVYLTAISNGWVQNDPFANYKIKLERVDRGYLTQRELNLIINKEFTNPRLEVIKDMFLFSCFTGIAYIDVRELTIANLQSMDGKQWIITKRHKTNNPVHIMLLDVPMQIIEKYRAQAKGGRLLPIPSNQKVNDYLKEIATICGIDKNLTFHLRRHRIYSFRLKKSMLQNNFCEQVTI